MNNNEVLLTVVVIVALIWFLLSIPLSTTHVGITGYDCTHLSQVSATVSGENGVLKNNQTGNACTFTASALRYPGAYENIVGDCPQEGCPFNIINAQYEARNMPAECDEAINNYMFILVDDQEKVYGCHGVVGA